MAILTEPMSPLHVRSEVCQFASHMDGSNANFAQHIEGSHAYFAPHMVWRHSFRGQTITKIAFSANYQKPVFQTTYTLGIYLTYVIIFEN